MYILKFDGMLQPSGSELTPVSLLGYGWILERDDVEIARGFGLFLRKCKTGSNIAEYLALIDGLETLVDLRIRHERVQIRGDAKCVIDQMTGSAGVSAPFTRELHQRARNLVNRFTSLTWVWVPRSENRHADRLSRRSFHYLRYSPQLYRKIHRSRLSLSQSERLVPLVDLRVHTPKLHAGNHLTNR
jgi:ribonuclease HI